MQFVEYGRILQFGFVILEGAVAMATPLFAELLKFELKKANLKAIYLNKSKEGNRNASTCKKTCVWKK